MGRHLHDEVVKPSNLLFREVCKDWAIECPLKLVVADFTQFLFAGDILVGISGRLPCPINTDDTAIILLLELEWFMRANHAIPGCGVVCKTLISPVFFVKGQ